MGGGSTADNLRASGGILCLCLALDGLGIHIEWMYCVRGEVMVGCGGV